MSINVLPVTKCVRTLYETIDETDFQEALKNQLTLQKELYQFFGTQPFEVIKDFFMYIPKGSIFFHGDNINEPEILYKILKISEKTTSLTSNGVDEIYQYKIDTQKISLDGPVIKIMTTNEKTGVKIENTIPQTSALLSKASNLRLISNIKYSYEESIQKIADITWDTGRKQYKLKSGSTDKQNLLDLFIEIENDLDFIYNTSEEALFRKQKSDFVVFDQSWAREKRSNNKYIYRGTTELKFLTKSLLTTMDSELQYKIDHFSDTQYIDELNKFYVNCREYFLLLSKPEDEFLKPPAKTQFFGNPCAETNITLSKGSSHEAKTDSKYLYSMHVYMFQNDIFLLDYWKLARIFETHTDSFQETIAKYTGFTGLDKRSMFWGSYFKGLIDNSSNTEGIFTYPFEINPTITLNNDYSYSQKIYEELEANYEKFNNNTYKYKLRNYHPKEDSPIITHLNFILNLRGFSMNIQGYTDFDPAESYIIPTRSSTHPRLYNFFTNIDIIGIRPTASLNSIICREYTIFNSPTNLLFLCYSSTLPNYMIPPVSPEKQALYNSYFGDGVTMDEQKKAELIDINNRLSDEDGNMFIDFSNRSLFDSKQNYNKFAVNIYANKIKFGPNFLKIISKKYTNPTGGGITKDIPQFIDLQTMLAELEVRKNIYNTILTKLSNIKYKNNTDEYYLSMINNNLLTQNPLFTNFTNHFNGFKLIFVKSDNSDVSNVDLNDLKTIPDEGLGSGLIDLTDINISNLINNVSSGKILNYNTNEYAAFYGGDDCLIDFELQSNVILQHDITDFGRRHFNGALFELIKYNYNCPNKWSELRDKMNPLEVSVCGDIAKKISESNDKIIEDITQMKPKTCDVRGDPKNCLERINKLVEIYNVNNVDDNDDVDDDVDDDALHFVDSDTLTHVENSSSTSMSQETNNSQETTMSLDSIFSRTNLMDDVNTPKSNDMNDVNTPNSDDDDI
jgi:hypothetical protein